MDHLSDLIGQVERMRPHDSPAFTVSDTSPAPTVPVMPSMREVDALPPIRPFIPPPAPVRTGQNTVPVLAVGMKRSAADAELDADAVSRGKRVKVRHSEKLDAEQAEVAQPELPDAVTGRKRNAHEVGFDEGALPPTKRLRQDEPISPISLYTSHASSIRRA